MKAVNLIRFALPAFLALFLFVNLQGQKYAYVDTEYILDNIPEYKDAQNQLNDLSEQYQAEIEEKMEEINALYQKYEAESVLMPEDVKKARLEEINQKKQELHDLQQKRFGPEGDLFLKREELVKPIQEKIYNAIEEIATDQNYAFVFDRAGSLSILYVNARYDISDDVLDKVGAELGTVRREDRVRKEYQPTPSSSKKPGGVSPGRPGGGKAPGPVRGSERK
ncbi:MAG: hypothetical protein Kow00127_07490 [Bacteroidales bacterium]